MVRRGVSVLLVGGALLVSVLSTVLMVPVVYAQSQTPARQMHSVTTGPKCSGARCSSTDPYDTWCAGQSFDNWEVLRSTSLVNSKGQSSGYLQLWWSATCQTNWSRIVPGSAYTSASVSLSSNPTVEDERSILAPNAPTQPANTPMLTEQEYAPNLQVCAVGSFQAPSGSNFDATIKQRGAHC